MSRIAERNSMKLNISGLCYNSSTYSRMLQPIISVRDMHHSLQSTQYLPIETSGNVHSSHLYSFLLPKFYLMIILSHPIQAPISLSTCCKVCSNERTLNLLSYHIQQSTLALSTISLTAAHNSYHRNTQQGALNTNHEASVPATATVSIISYAC